MWTKRIFWSLLVLGIVYGVVLFILIHCKKWANEQLRQEHTIWAQNLGLVSKEMRIQKQKRVCKRTWLLC